MILFLTYHKVSTVGDQGDKDFYTVPSDVMAAQINAMVKAGYQALPIDRLLTHDGRPSYPGNNFVLSYDDSTLDHYQIVFPLLQEAGLRAIFFVPTAKLNKPGYLADSQVQEIGRAGHIIGLHSHEHRRLDNMDDESLREQFKLSRDILGNLVGEAPWFFAPPGGFINERVREVAQGFGVRAIRTMRWGYNETVDLTALETIPLNRHTAGREFQEILATRRGRSLYFCKQAMKALIPMRAYEQLRGLVFRLAGKN